MTLKNKSDLDLEYFVGVKKIDLKNKILIIFILINCNTFLNITVYT